MDYTNQIIEQLIVNDYEKVKQISKVAYNYNMSTKQVKDILLKYDYKNVPGKRHMERISREERMEHIAKICLDWILDFSCSASYMPSCSTMLSRLGITEEEASELGCGHYIQ